MTVQASITINASRAAVWAAITDVAGFAQLLSGVQKIEIIERPVAGLVGLKWKETRMLFGKEATVEKTIIAAAENEFYTTVARDAGFVFTTYQRIADHEGPLILRSIHETVSQGFTARLKALPMVFFKGVIRKAIMQDLKDIKVAVERSVRMSPDLADAAFAGNVAEVIRLLNTGTNVNEHGRTHYPLHAAIESNSVDCVRVLISRGADIELASKGSKGITPLAHAVDSAIDGTIQTGGKSGEETIEIIRLLLEAGADVEPGLKVAHLYGNDKMVELLTRG